MKCIHLVSCFHLAATEWKITKPSSAWLELPLHLPVSSHTHAFWHADTYRSVFLRLLHLLLNFVLWFVVDLHINAEHVLRPRRLFPPFAQLADILEKFWELVKKSESKGLDLVSSAANRSGRIDLCLGQLSSLFFTTCRLPGRCLSHLAVTCNWAFLQWFHCIKIAAGCVSPFKVFPQPLS